MTQDALISILLYVFGWFLLRNYDATAVVLAARHPRGGIRFENDLPDTGRLLTRETKSEHLKKLSESFYKFKLPGKPKVVDLLLSGGWSAGGMPFNVLYTPNTRQQKILRSVPRNPSVRADGKPPPSRWEKPPRKPSAPRKYYSVIPHFFVSHRW